MELTEQDRRKQIDAGWRCPDCDIPLRITTHLDSCPGVAAMNRAWEQSFPKREDDPMGFRTLPSPGRAFEAAWWAGRTYERECGSSSKD